MTNTEERSGTKAESGVTLLETMIAIVVLMIGLLAVLATLALAVGNTQSVQLDTVARQKTREAMESIYTARETSQVSFDAIQNVGNGNGIFTVGFTPVTDPGPDGLGGTADDVPAAPVRLPGPSGVITGGSEDVLVDLTGFSRQIAISDIANQPNLRQIKVTVKYPVPQGWYKSYQIQGLISAFR